MKMSAMMGPQQNKARAVLADILARSEGLEKSRLDFTNMLDNSLSHCSETAEFLKQQLRHLLFFAEYSSSLISS